MKRENQKPIYVTRPSLAPLDEFVNYLKEIWESGVMTHNGPLMQKLEKELCKYLNVKDLICLANGTCALQLAIRAMDLEGEIITTPFTFIATANIIAWERCKPVFVDIDPETWNIDTEKIEEKITDKTSAIMAVHVFSAPCDVMRIQEIADKYNLKIIYDAAHAMCVNVDGKSIMDYGHVSCTSFHATKLFNTCEGGACITNDDRLASRIRRMRFFGFNEQKEIIDDGMNAKMTEVNAGLGLANLKILHQVRINRREKYELYQRLLEEMSFVRFQKFNREEYNYSYMPVLFKNEDILLRVRERLEMHKIYTRRYFYPSLNNVSIFGQKEILSVSEKVAKTILCLPLYNELSANDINKICNIIKGFKLDS